MNGFGAVIVLATLTGNMLLVALLLKEQAAVRAKEEESDRIYDILKLLIETDQPISEIAEIAENQFRVPLRKYERGLRRLPADGDDKEAQRDVETLEKALRSVCRKKRKARLNTL